MYYKYTGICIYMCPDRLKTCDQPTFSNPSILFPTVWTEASTIDFDHRCFPSISSIGLSLPKIPIE